MFRVSDELTQESTIYLQCPWDNYWVFLSVNISIPIYKEHIYSHIIANDNPLKYFCIEISYLLKWKNCVSNFFRKPVIIFNTGFKVFKVIQDMVWNKVKTTIMASSPCIWNRTQLHEPMSHLIPLLPKLITFSITLYFLNTFNSGNISHLQILSANMPSCIMIKCLSRLVWATLQRELKLQVLTK